MPLLNDCYISFLNLDHRKDRKEHIEKELERVGIKAVRTRGKLPQEFDLTNPKYRVMRDRTAGAIGCHYGQIEIMEKALELGKHAFVLEDDVHFCEDFNERLKYFENFLDNNSWAIAWLGGTVHNPAWWHKKNHSLDLWQCSCNLEKDFERTYDERIIRTYGAFCTYAYIVNVQWLNPILDFLEANVHLSMGIDWLMILLQPHIPTYMMLPGMCRQIDNKSDIGQGDTIFSGFAALNGTFDNSKYWFQEKMQDFEPNSFFEKYPLCK